MVKKVALVIVMVVIGVNLFFYNRTSSNLVFDENGEQVSTKEMLQDPELQEGMESFLESRDISITDAEPTDEDPSAIPDSEDYLRNEENNAVEDDGSPQEPDRFGAINRQVYKENELREYKEEVSALSLEIPKDEEQLNNFLQAGNNAQAQELRQAIQMKQQRLNELRNNPPEDLNDGE